MSRLRCTTSVSRGAKINSQPLNMTGIMVSASTGVMTSLLRKLATLMGEEFAKLKNLRKEVEEISAELISMKDALERLEDVDQLDVQTKRWRDIVREMSYDIEDIIDEFMRKIGKKNKKSGIVKKTIESLQTFKARHQIIGQIEEIKKLVHQTSERRDRYKLNIPTLSNVAVDQRVVTLYANAANHVGIEGPSNELVNRIEDEEKKLKVVSIVGFGGLGKTTLANSVHNKLKGEFNCHAFVPVSQTPDIPKLLRCLLLKLHRGHNFHDFELHDLLEEVREHLKNKRYFIIIDDLWHTSAWNIIKCAFPENDLGSRVIVTTRKLDVAEACCFSRHDIIFRMKPLGEEDSRRLFFDRIFGSEEACPSQLKDFSVEILKKCGGLPLAIISISSLLASENSNQNERWEQVQSSLSSISGTNLTLEAMRQILNLSYKDLPRHLKTCFLYLGMYPEDHMIRRCDLENRWVAEGFVSKAHGQSLEQIATSYFNELVNRSLIQPVELNRDRTVSGCKVHDMMLDLILHRSAEENFMTVIDSPEATTGLVQMIRRMLFCLNGARLPGDLSLKQVRSLAIFGSCKNIPSLKAFKFIRVFTAEFASSSGDDEGKVDLTGLSKLHLLRYLRIQGCRWCQLPAQIRGLQQLETFEVDDGSVVPSDIFHVPSLVRLYAPGVKRLPEGIGKMTSLQYLWEFDILNNSPDNIKDLGQLTNLKTLFLTCGDSWVPKKDCEISEDEMARHMDLLSSLRKLCGLKILCIRSQESKILQQLTSSPLPDSLVTFRLLVTSRVPNWIGELHNLRNLRLSVRILDQDGLGILAELPALIDLELELQGISFSSELERATEEMVIVYGTSFPALEHFSLRSDNMPRLTFQPGAMAKLQRLSLSIHADGWKHEDTPIGIEHLLALDRIFVGIGCQGATESEKINAESAFRSAVDRHPRHPHVKYNCGDFVYGFWA